MVTARQVNIDRRVDFDAGIAPVANRGSRALGIGIAEFAAGAAGARDEASADFESSLPLAPAPQSPPSPAQHCRRARLISADSARPSGEYRRRPNRVRFSPVRASDRRSPCRAASDTPIQFRPCCFCLCTPICAMRSNMGRGTSASDGTRVNACPSFSSTSTRNFSIPMPSMTYFSRALSRLVRSPRSMKTRTMASAILVASAGLTMMQLLSAKAPWRNPCGR